MSAEPVPPTPPITGTSEPRPDQVRELLRLLDEQTCVGLIAALTMLSRETVGRALAALCNADGGALDWPAVMAVVERARAARLASGLPGTVLLSVDEAPGKELDWHVEVRSVAGRRRRRS